MRLRILALCLTALFSVNLDSAFAGSPTQEQLKTAAAAARSVNGLCPVMGRLVTTTGGSAAYKGETIAFCCPGCAAKFKADPTRYMDRMRLNPPKYWYVTKTTSVASMRTAKTALQCANGGCPLTGTAIVERGGSTMYGRQKIGFCCSGCRAKFVKNPEKYMKALRADPLAYAYTRPGPTNTQMRVARKNLRTANGRCPVMGKLVVLKGGTVAYGTQRIGFCCPPCVAKFNKNPEKFIKLMRSEPAAYGYVAAAR